MFARITLGALARTLLPMLGLVACTGSPGTLAMQPDFDVMTPAGIASVSIRQSPPGMPEAEFTQQVKLAMERAGSGIPVEQPLPAQRIVWHVMSASRGNSRLVVNVFNGAHPFAYEQESITDSAPTAVMTSAIESMSERLLADIAAQTDTPDQSGGRVSQNEADRTILSRR